MILQQTGIRFLNAPEKSRKESIGTRSLKISSIKTATCKYSRHPRTPLIAPGNGTAIANQIVGFVGTLVAVACRPTL
jgi:hypothetical protein